MKRLIHRPGRGQRVIVKASKTKPRVYQDRAGRWMVECATDNRTTIAVDKLPENARGKTRKDLTPPTPTR